MRYKEIHDAIISSRKAAFPDLRTIHRAKAIAAKAGCHAHHIIPRCMGGSDHGDNLVVLTPREHFLVHKLLWKIHGGKMALALFYMSNTDKHEGVLTSRQYEMVYREAMQSRLEGSWMENNAKAARARAKDPEWRRKNNETVKRTVSTTEWRERMLEGMKKRSRNPEWLKNTREATKRTVKTDKWINNQRAGIEAMKADPQWPDIVAERAKRMVKNEKWRESKRKLETKNCKPVRGFNINDDSVVVLVGTREKLDLPIGPPDICACITGRQKTAKGYTWRYATYEEVEKYRPGHEWLELNKHA